MKKITRGLILVFAIIVLAACGGNTTTNETGTVADGTSYSVIDSMQEAMFAIISNVVAVDSVTVSYQDGMFINVTRACSHYRITI